MRTAAKRLLSALFGISLIICGGIVAFGAGEPSRVLNMPASGLNNLADDDDEPEITDRVARISFLRGEARVRRAGIEEWEKATLNLPIVEGDEIATDEGTRIEIQFDKNQHLRLAGNSFLKVVTLKDEGIAVSFSLGTMTLGIRAFDKEKAYF